MRRLIGWIKPKTRLRSTSPRTSLFRKAKIALISLLLITFVSTICVSLMDKESLKYDLIKLSADAGLTLEVVQLNGRAHTPKETLMKVVNLKIGTPILGIDLRQLHAKINEIGWVADAIVERRLPGIIRISLRERIPIALLQNNGRHKLIELSGEIIDGADPSQFTHLTVVSGKNAAPHAATILSILKTEPELFSEIWALSYRSERRWDVHLKNGMAVRLPEIDPVSAWSRLAMIDRKRNIISRDLAVIDLRVPHQLVVEPNIPVRGKGSKT